MKVAVCQLLVEGGEPFRNLDRAKGYIEKAVNEGAELVLLPETMDLGWTHPSVYSEALPIPGERSFFFSELAKKYSIYICVGLTEKMDKNYFNTAIILNPSGEMIAKHQKINLLEVELPFYQVGQSLTVTDTSFGKVGLSICADNYYESLCLGHSIARMGAQIILSPCAWTVDHFVTEKDNPYNDKWLKPIKELAMCYHIPVVTATAVGYIVGGPYEGKKMVGCSLTVDKNGTIHQGVFNEFSSYLIMLDVELGSETRKGTQFSECINKK